MAAASVGKEAAVAAEGGAGNGGYAHIDGRQWRVRLILNGGEFVRRQQEVYLSTSLPPCLSLYPPLSLYICIRFCVCMRVFSLTFITPAPRPSD